MKMDLKIVEKEVCDLLQKHSVNSLAHDVLAPWVAYKSLAMGHLYSDLGLKSRTEMGRFMQRNFPTLAQDKPKDKLWKKFIYDEIGKIAPACKNCSDNISCFSCISVNI
ncbi:MAG: hydrogenase [Sulfurimonas sp. RIFOXYD12_FULL_33_39]|uniref:nitrogen fixation protein NifQ n=1 Tax=unclassified Sulfurimonas TaxID=2623549 RepID=UPI0008D5C8BA|nr:MULTISPECIES: nitrogen fixation protein NifQ [unclassified Sulfurimonas]OHE10876.1 MAG: hydrogenase [Sulfurimonas sp. RIFOXYD12_FULL_33_39]OHE13354.1 MAG: hydrogenase [Sulfurimonas sp. RIFOXYD2_FULL_34_21]DAB28050.1 MAG TPA: hydrogenase [Sulfurimonas sp. UBA10385]